MKRKMGFFLAGALLLAPSLFAQSPHFVSVTAAVNSKGALVISYKEAGLAGGETINYIAKADYSAKWGCVSKGEDRPQTDRKHVVEGPVSGTTTDEAEKNGQISGSISLSAPEPAAEKLQCTENQEAVLFSVTFSKVLLEDYTNLITATVGGTYTANFHPSE
jgi:hypothetical protein